jgi:uncharacterized protein (TIGR00297 family)
MRPNVKNPDQTDEGIANLLNTAKEPARTSAAADSGRMRTAQAGAAGLPAIRAAPFALIDVMSQTLKSSESRSRHVDVNIVAVAGMLLLVALFGLLVLTGGPDARSIVKDRFLLAALCTGVFTLAARWLRGVTTSGAVAGWCAALLLWLRGGWLMFAVLMGVFLMTLAATRFRASRKLGPDAAERRVGRDAGQVAANLGVAALLAAVAPMYWHVSALACMCEVAADTVSSEIGQAIGGRPLLITTFRRVEPGANGAISLWGTVVGIGAAAAIAVLAMLVRYFSFGRIFIPSDVRAIGVLIAAAMIGMFFDSLLGATLERRGALDNNSVNFAGTAMAAFAAVAIVRYGL